MSAAAPAVLAFDVFGTVVDWFGGVKREVDAFDMGVDGREYQLGC